MTTQQLKDELAMYNALYDMQIQYLASNIAAGKSYDQALTEFNTIYAQQLIDLQDYMP